MAQKPERRVEMQKIERSPSRRDALFALFPLFACFANHRMAGSGLGMKAFGPSRRFSSWLWRFGRSAQLLQKGGHGPTHLRQCGKRVASLPRAITSLQQRTSQHQQIVRASHDLRPACAALRRTEPWLIPEQLLFVKTIAMLLRIAQAIARADVGQRSRGITLPDKPTDPGITRLVTGSIADDLNHRELDVASRAQVQVLPTAHLDARSFGIHPFPARIRFAMAVLVFALEADESWEGVDAKGARIQVRCWKHLHLRTARDIELSVIQIIRYGASDKPRDPRISWFVWKGDPSAPLADISPSYRLRYSQEHGYRFDKQELLWDKPRFSTPQRSARWTQIVACAHNLLVLARPLLQGCYRPWERGDSLPTLAQVRRAMPTLLQQLGTPAKAPQPRGKAPGRAKGFHPQPRTRHAVIRKTSKKRKKSKKSISS